MVSATTKQHVSLNSDVLYNNYPAKFPVTITRDKKGKKDVKINTSWKNINSNTCTGNEKNIAFITGKFNDLKVLDFDDQGTIDWFEQNIHPFDTIRAHRVKTFKGVHLYFKYTSELDQLFSKYGKPKVKVVHHLDVRSENCIIFYGNGYTLQHFENDIDFVPPKFIDFLRSDFEKNKPESQNEEKPINTINFEETDDDIVFILNHLSLNRCESYESWIKVAMCLKNSFGKKYVDLFHEWSKKSRYHSYDKQIIDNYWNSIPVQVEGKSLTVASLYFWLQNDNRAAYDKYLKKKKVIIDKFTEGSLFYDYTKYVNNITTFDNVKALFRKTLRFVHNKGNRCYAIKIRDENNIVRWSICKDFPCGISTFYILGPDDEVKSFNFSSVVEELKCEPAFTKQNIVFKPYPPNITYSSDEDPNINLFSGWSVPFDPEYYQKLDASILEPVFKHIFQVICNEDNNLFNYFIGWFANIIQKCEKNGTCLCIISDSTVSVKMSLSIGLVKAFSEHTIPM